MGSRSLGLLSTVFVALGLWQEEDHCGEIWGRAERAAHLMVARRRERRSGRGEGQGGREGEREEERERKREREGEGRREYNPSDLTSS